jgi:hypothetical protein
MNWRVGRVVLGLSDEEFYSLTPKQLYMLLDEHERQIEHQEFMLAQVCSTTANWSMCAPKQPLKPEMFMPSAWAKEEKTTRKRKPSAKALAARVRAAFSGLQVSNG